MDDLVAASVAQPRFFLGLTAGFSLLALVLALVGIYGVMSYNVNRRSSEMGLRMALGASRGNVLQMILRQGLLWASFGIGLGLLASLGLTRLYAGLLFEVSPTDGLTYATVSAALLTAAMGACLIPAFRATRVDSARALRNE